MPRESSSYPCSNESTCRPSRKTRILSDSQQQLLRLDRDGDRMAFAAASENCCRRFSPLVDSQAAVVLADYDKGVITPALAHAVIDRCRQRGIPCVVDPKKLDFRVYARATVVTPNLMEAERSAGRPLAGDDGWRTPPTKCGPRWNWTPC